MLDLSNTGKEVWADSAYRSLATEARLQEKGLKPHDVRAPIMIPESRYHILAKASAAAFERLDGPSRTGASSLRLTLVVSTPPCYL